MKKRWRIVLLATALIMALLVVVVCLVLDTGGPPEPVYQGKPLRYYLRHFPQQSGARNGLARWADPSAAEAVRTIGNDAIPTLLQWLKAKHSPIKARLADISERLPWIHYVYWDAYERNEAGCNGFHILGPTAAAAVPQIMEIFRLKISDESREAAIWSLGYIGSNAAAALPLLKAGTKESSARVRGACIQALGDIRTSPNEAVRCLIQCLADQDIYVRAATAEALGKFGEAAKPAVPALVKALSDTNETVNAAAEHALKAIDPAALEKARKEGKVRPR